MGENRRKSALNVMDGVEQPSQINAELVGKLKSKRVKKLSVEEYVNGIFSGNRTILSKAITLVESSLHKDQEKSQEIIDACLKHQSAAAHRQSTTSNIQHTAPPLPAQSFLSPPSSSIRIGITGVPGVGKSTFIEALGTHLTAQGHKLAVLAIDPSSTLSKGSILGDKTRMEELAVDPNAFIRPSPSAGSLGGVARKTRETIILCEAAGYDVIFVETVGVGQSETSVHAMVDFFLLLMLSGAGDELQGIKRGIIEMADAIIINKADGDNLLKAQTARAEYAHALHLFPPSASGWIPVADICSSRTKMGIDNTWNIIQKHHRLMCESGFFIHKRREQNKQILMETIQEGLKHHFFSRKDIQSELLILEEKISAGKVNPYQAAQKLLEKYYHNR